MQKLRIAFLLGAYLLGGCSSLTDAGTTPVTMPGLTPYFTRTPASLFVPVLPPTPTIAPTATPIVYTIVRNDTLIDIAWRNGITLDDLLAANPGVQPDALTVGQTIILPGPASAVLITPVPLELSQPLCQPSGDGITCLMLIQNPDDKVLEDVILQAILYDGNGVQIAERQVVPPLSLIPAHAAVPASVFFKGVGQVGFVQARVITSIQPDAWQERYIQAELQNVLIGIAWDGLSADVQADVYIPVGQAPAADIWVLAVAYATDGTLVGFRRVEWRGLLQPGESQRFTFSVYGLNRPVGQVDLFVEARP